MRFASVISAARNIKTPIYSGQYIRFSVFFVLSYVLAIGCEAADLNQQTAEAFERYVGTAEARMNASCDAGGAFFRVDSLPEPRRQQVYGRLRSGQVEILDNTNTFKVPDGLIHDWTGIVFIRGISLERAVSFLQDYHNGWRTFSTSIRRSKLLEHTDSNTFRIYLQLYRDFPIAVSFNSEYQTRYSRIDATHEISRAVSTRIAELRHPENPNSPEFPVGTGHGYIWRWNTYRWLEEKDGGVYIQVESIALSRGVPAVVGWIVDPLIERVAREDLANLLDTTRRALLSPEVGRLNRALENVHR